MSEIDISGCAAIPRQIGVIEDIEVEAVGSQHVALVVRLVDCPVVAQTLWDIAPELGHCEAFVVLDNGESLAVFLTYAVGDDAAAVARLSLSIAPTTPSRWNLYSFFQTSVLRIPVADLIDAIPIHLILGVAEEVEEN